MQMVTRVKNGYPAAISDNKKRMGPPPLQVGYKGDRRGPRCRETVGSE